ncbi:MAG: cold-shock protein [Zoogloea sp.]|nr:MAG: cold-shock protein [Zoogloea sp.]
MHIEGTLARWNDQSGFGFIAPIQGGPEVFVHISAFPLDGTRPIQGERLRFEIISGEDGTRRAHILQRLDRPSHPSQRPATARHPEKRSRGFFTQFILLVLFGLLAYAAYSHFTRQAPFPQSFSSPPVEHYAPSRPAGTLRTNVPAFKCDGRIYCAQMNSCAEATWFLRNCPGVRMDGNGDGVPCEKQWCG